MAERLEARFPEIPGYRIESILGRGSMARVFRGRQLGIDRPVAIKVLRDEVLENEKILKRLMREARLAARFNHPHIVRALDAGVHEGSCYFVMDLVEGRSLRDIVEHEGPMGEDRALDLAIEIAEALGELHRAHVVHRDVKPANIIVDLEGRALLADLGLAKIEFDSSMTSQHRTVGTPAYMAPEQARNPDKVDSRSDLFSLGATLFYMLTGHSPFEGESVSAVITRILYDEAPPLSSLRPGVALELEQIVARLLEKDPRRRYQSPSALLRDLRACQRGVALPLGPAAPLRDRRRVLLVAVAGLALVVLLSVLFWPGAGDEPGAEPKVEREAVSPAGPSAGDGTRSDEAGLEARIDRVLRSIEATLAVDLDAGRLDDARRDLAGAWRERFERALGAPIAELPRIAQLRWENARLDYERRITGAEVARKEEALAALRRRFEAATAGLERREVYLDREAIIAELAGIDSSWADRIDRDAFDLLRRQVADRLLDGWRKDFDGQLDRARVALEDGDFASSLAMLEALERREPGRLGAGPLASLRNLRDRIDAGRGELDRRIATALEQVDILPPAGSPELGSRDFEGLLERIGPLADGLAADEGGAGGQLLRELVAVLREVEAWPARLGQALKDGRISGAAPIVDRRGKARVVADFREQADGILRFDPAPGRVDEIPLREVAVACLLALVPPAEAGQRDRAAAFLDYCDGDLLAAEQRLAALAADDPLRGFLGERLARAWPELAQVTSSAGKEAFRIWNEVLASYRAGDFGRAESLAEPLRRDDALKKSDWFRAKREDIRVLLAELELRANIALRLGRAAPRYEVLRLDPPEVRAVWTFTDENEAADFDLGAGLAWSAGKIERLVPVAAADLVPDRCSAIHLDLPADPTRAPVTVEIDFRGSARPGEEPRYLIVSVCGHHLGILCRLRQSLPFRHLALHGVENLVQDYVDFGRVAAWSGALAGFRQAFGGAGGPRKVMLEGGRLHRLSLRLDPADQSLSLRLDDEPVFHRRLDRLDPGQDGLEIRAPMPFALEELRVGAAIRL